MAQGLWFVGPRLAELREESVADPGPSEVQVAAICSLVSAGSEMTFYRGEGKVLLPRHRFVGDPPDLLIPTAQGQLPFPVKFGYQEVGKVVAAGAEAGYEVGDRVLCSHPHQDLFTLDAALVAKIPADLSVERAAFNLAVIAINALLTTPARVGECVAVSGLGIVGWLTAHLARLTAGRLILIDPSSSRRKRAEWIGADAVVDPAEAPDAVAELTGGRGVDLFFEASGAPAALQTAINLTALEGRISVSSWYGTTVSIDLSPEFMLRRQHIISTGPGLPPDAAPRWDYARLREVAWDVLRKVPVDDYLITHRVPFQDAPKAYALLDNPDNEALAVLLQHASV